MTHATPIQDATEKALRLLAVTDDRIASLTVASSGGPGQHLGAAVSGNAQQRTPGPRHRSAILPGTAP